jgi:hypothetical protein
MLKVDDEWIVRAEQQYRGFRKTVDYYEALTLPPCPRCGSADTAKVSSGLVGLSIHVAAATSKIKLLPNGHPADFHCAACDQFFDAS